MNQTTTYEQLIAAKLQELSAPGKIDAIWARIEQQLDVEMPTDESGPTDTGASSNPGFYFPGNKFFYIFLAAVAGIYFLSRPFAVKHEVTETSLQKNYEVADSLPVSNTPAENSVNENRYMDKADMPVTNALTQKDSVDTEIPVKEQPVAQNEAEPALKTMVDSVTTTIPKPVIVQTDTIPKKGRGVKGINSSDYKIAPVKKGNHP